jgi:hypothetical protein
VYNMSSTENDEIIEPYPPIIDACDGCGCFKHVVYYAGRIICHSCMREMEHDSLCTDKD